MRLGYVLIAKYCERFPQLYMYPQDWQLWLLMITFCPLIGIMLLLNCWADLSVKPGTEGFLHPDHKYIDVLDSKFKLKLQMSMSLWRVTLLSLLKFSSRGWEGSYGKDTGTPSLSRIFLILRLTWMSGEMPWYENAMQIFAAI